MQGVLTARRTRGAAATLTDQVYRRIRGDILSGRLVPGLKLRVEHLKAQHGTGASAIREALSRLRGDGLVAMEERRGFFVSPVSLDELWDVTEMRTDLETKALRRAIEKGDGDWWEAGIVAAYHRLSRLDGQLRDGPPDDEWERRHTEFHEALVAACASRWLMHFRSLLFDQSERYRRLSLSQKKIDRDVPGEHKAIMEATLDRDTDRACGLLAAHIRFTADIVAVSIAA